MPAAEAASSSKSFSSDSSDSFPSSSSSSSADEPAPKSCRVCSDEEDLFASMRRKMYATALRKDKRGDGGGGGGGQGTSAAPARDQRGRHETSRDSLDNSSSSSISPSPASLSSAASPSASSSSSSSSSKASAAATASAIAASVSSASSSSEGLLASGRPLPCPPDATRLGRATWTFLHSVAAYFPIRPSPVHSQQALALLHSLPHLYPCPHCAQHLASYYQQHRPEEHVQGRQQLGLYLCEVHNEVRQRQGKRPFDCARWRERWGGDDWDEQFGEQKTGCDPREYADVDEEA